MQVVFPFDDLYPSLYDRVLEELSNSTTGQISIHKSSETVAQYNSKDRNFNRVVLRSGQPIELLCNVTLPHGHCLPVTDPVRIQELAAELH